MADETEFVDKHKLTPGMRIDPMWKVNALLKASAAMASFVERIIPLLSSEDAAVAEDALTSVWTAEMDLSNNEMRTVIPPRSG